MKKIIFFSVLFLIFIFWPLTSRALTAFDLAQHYYDLKADDIVVFPAKPAVNQICTVTVKVKNVGTNALINSTGLSTFSYQFDNFQLTELTYTAPTPGQDTIARDDYMIYIFEGKFTNSGEKTLTFTANDKKELIEEKIKSEDEEWTVTLYDNDKITEKVTVLSTDKTDLKVESIVPDRNYPIAKENMRIVITVINNSEVSLTDGYMLAKENISPSFGDFNQSELVMTELPTLANPLTKGERFTYIYSGQYYQSGEKTFGFAIDKNNHVTEADETNNSTSTTFKVYASASDADKIQFSDFLVTNVSSSSVKISWKTDRKAVCNLMLRQKTSFAPEEEKPKTAFGTVHSVEITALTPNTKNYYYIKGLASTTPELSATKEFTTLNSDKPFILVGPQSTAIDTATVKINWQTNLTANGYVYYYKLSDKKLTKAGSDTLVLNHEVQLSKLANEEYEYYVLSTSSTKYAVKSAPARFRPTANTDVSTQTVTQTGTDTGSACTSCSSNVGVTLSFPISNSALYASLAGKIVLKVEASGEAYYVHPSNKNMYYLGRPEDAFRVMREKGVGITNANLTMIPIGLTAASGVDSDSDGLSDIFEDAIGTDKNKKDTDGDDFNDKAEIEGGFNPKGTGKIATNGTFAAQQKGKILLQVESKGEAWYVNPANGKRYFLGRPADAFSVMRYLGLGISNQNFEALD